MAGTLVGGSLLSASLQVLFDRIASRDLLDFFRGRKLNDGLLEKLKIMMISVNGVLDDAEQQQISLPAVKDWLDELKDAVYLANDLLDEIAYEAQRSKLEADTPSSLDQVRNLFSFLNGFKKGLEVKLEWILERLDFLVKQKDALGLRKGIGFGERIPSWKLPKTVTTCLIDESEIYGRDNDKEAIMELLLSDDPNGNDVGVVPIVGMGGVGKTTLAQLLFNDSRAGEWFDIRTWVCVSEEFDVFKITKNIVEEITRRKCDTGTLNQLQLELQERLTGKKFLLVLDDVWNEQYTDWDILRRPLKAGAQGSKVIVTTRIERVALVTRTIPCHRHLKELAYDDSWFLFVKHAFDDGHSSAHPDLEVISREIVRKCKGLPLAAKTLGGLLRSIRDVEEWVKILKSYLWDLREDKILPALKLSYHYLHPHLKRCFCYCAIFPKDYKFQKRDLVLLWMAEGFLVQVDKNMEMEEIGNKYFNDLVSRSFFQQSGVCDTIFVMHDLMNDLARFVSGEFCCCLEDENSGKITGKTRHLLNAAGQHDAFKKIEGKYKAEILRTLLSINHVDSKVIHKLLPTVKHVRALSLFSCNNIVELVDSIGDCKHLRYLNLRMAAIHRLPQSVTSMYNLQTLILSGCSDLIELPINMRRLVNLRHLILFSLEKLQGMPPEMGKLTKLQTLTHFILGKSNGSRLKELGKLHHLSGELSIQNLQNARDAQDALEAHLNCKKHLKSLWLIWDSNTTDSQHERCVLESLEPHNKIEFLSIEGYGGTKFPQWIGDPFFSNLTSLYLHGCRYCSSLPPLGQLVSLKHLTIRRFDGIVAVGPEFYGSCISTKVPFGPLETLYFYSMPQWQEWISCDHCVAFLLLRELSIISCRKLTKSLPNHLPSLTTLEIIGCDLLVDSLPKAPKMLHMTLTGSNHSVLLEKSWLEVSKIPSLDWVERMVELCNTLEKN